MKRTLVMTLGVLTIVPFLIPRFAKAQEIEVGGLAYVDYFYTLSSPDSEEEGFHGFTYRRLYLTTDFVLSDRFDGRARLEANEGTTGSSGPVPYVKDLWLRWRYGGEHSATIGVTSPPAFTVSEDVWEYRSLEKTILDLQDVVDSRDFGIRLDGPLVPDGTVRYSVMAANNSASRPETDSYKRGYAQIGFFPSDRLSFTVGADHAGFDGALESATRVSAFGGYSTDVFRIGVEPFWYNVTPDAGDELSTIGVSLFGSAALTPAWELAARLDLVEDERDPSAETETFVLVGAAYSPIDNVRIIPNLWMFDMDGDAHTLGRMTVDISF